MSYCVNCGVKLSDGAERCPLCAAPAWHPAAEEPPAPYFPPERSEVGPESKRALVILLTSMLVSASVSCALLNLILRPGQRWSLYVIGAAVMLWVWFVSPMLLRALPVFFKLTLDVAAVGIYVYLISVNLDGQVWFRGLALPILGETCVVVFLLSFLLRDHRHSAISNLSCGIGALGLFALGMEFCIDRYLLGVWEPGWSLVVAVVCAALIVPLQVIRHVPALWEEARRRFDW